MCGSPSLIEIDCSAATLEIVLCLMATFDPFTLESLENCVDLGVHMEKLHNALCRAKGFGKGDGVGGSCRVLL